MPAHCSLRIRLQCLAEGLHSRVSDFPAKAAAKATPPHSRLRPADANPPRASAGFCRLRRVQNRKPLAHHPIIDVLVLGAVEDLHEVAAELPLLPSSSANAQSARSPSPRLISWSDESHKARPIQSAQYLDEEDLRLRSSPAHEPLTSVGVPRALGLIENDHMLRRRCIWAVMLPEGA